MSLLSIYVLLDEINYIILLLLYYNLAMYRKLRVSCFVFQGVPVLEPCLSISVRIT